MAQVAQAAGSTPSVTPNIDAAIPEGNAALAAKDPERMRSADNALQQAYRADVAQYGSKAVGASKSFAIGNALSDSLEASIREVTGRPLSSKLFNSR